MGDYIFKHKQRYRDKVGYERKMISHRSVFEQAESVREAICDLVLREELDAMDLKIIAARDCSPMPSMREVARQMKVSHTAIAKRVATIRRLISASIPHFIRK